MGSGMLRDLIVRRASSTVVFSISTKTQRASATSLSLPPLRDAHLVARSERRRDAQQRRLGAAEALVAVEVAHVVWDPQRDVDEENPAHARDSTGRVNVRQARWALSATLSPPAVRSNERCGG